MINDANKKGKVYEEMIKEKSNDEIDDLTAGFSRAQAHLANIYRGNNNIYRGNNRILCNNCGKAGHVSRDCYRLKTCKRCGKTGHTDRVCRENIRRINVINNYEDDYYNDQDLYYTNDYEGEYDEDDDYIDKLYAAEGKR